MPVFPTQQKVADHLGVSRHTIKEWLQEGAPGKRGKYDSDEIAKWRKENKRSTEPDEELRDVRRRKSDAEARLTEAKAEQEILKASRMANTLVQLDDVDAFMAEAFTELRKLLARLPVEFSAGYEKKIQPQIENDLHDRLDIVLRSFHGWVCNTTELRDDR